MVAPGLDANDAFGRAPDGTAVAARWISGGPVTARIMTWGASLIDLRHDGTGHPLVLGAPDFAAYLGPMRYFGAIVGPVANRIAGGAMTVAGQRCRLDRNEAGRTTLHGGATGFASRNWRLEAAEDSAVTLGLRQLHGTGGFPGNIDVTVRYALEQDGALTIAITARTDRPTMVAPAFHGYWALDGRADLAAQTLTVAAADYLPVDAARIPCGGPAPVAGTRFDHRRPRRPDPALDHNFCLARRQGPLRRAGTLAGGGWRLTLDTTEVGLQVYAGSGIDTAPCAGLGGRPYGANAGIALEPQFWPDSPNRPEFPSPALLPGQIYRQVSRFAVTRT